MGRVRNDIDDGLEHYVDDSGKLAERPAARVLPHLDYAAVRCGDEFDVPDEDVYHWVAGGFTALTRYPVPHRLYPNHAGDPLAYPLPEPDSSDPSAIAVGAPPAPQQPVPAATAPTAAPQTAPAADAAGDAAKE